MSFVNVRDAFGRPVLLRLDAVAAIEGARDASDHHGDLWALHPVTAYRRVMLRSGGVLYLADDRDLLPQLGAFVSPDTPD